MSAGNSKPPSARIVTPDPPVNTVKNAQSIAQTTAVPPGIHPNEARNTFRQTLGRLAFGEQESAKREERNRCQRGLHRQLVGLDENRRRPDAVGQKQDDRQPAEHDEDRRSAAGCDVDHDHRTVKSDRHGRVLAYIDNDGTIKPGPYSTKVLGHVDSDGIVKADRHSTKVLGQVSPPHMEVKAALFLVI